MSRRRVDTIKPRMFSHTPLASLLESVVPYFSNYAATGINLPRFFELPIKVNPNTSAPSKPDQTWNFKKPATWARSAMVSALPQSAETFQILCVLVSRS